MVQGPSRGVKSSEDGVITGGKSQSLSEQHAVYWRKGGGVITNRTTGRISIL